MMCGDSRAVFQVPSTEQKYLWQRRAIRLFWGGHNILLQSGEISIKGNLDIPSHLIYKQNQDDVF